MRISEEIRTAGGRAYLVGGWVRDAMLGHDCRDFDIEVYHIGQESLLDILSRHGRPNLVGKAFGVIHLAMKGLHLDFSFPRTENKVGSGHRGFIVETHPDLTFAEAALRRDFTVNAMGMELPDLELVDPYKGEADLRSGILRHVGPAFIEDSLRVLRGVQFAARFGLTAAPSTVDLCRTLSLDDLSRERIGEEFRKWLVKGDRPSAGLRFFTDVGLEAMFPSIAPLHGSWERLGLLLDALVSYRDQLSQPQANTLMFAGLLSSQPNQATGFLQSWLPENDLLKTIPPLLEQAYTLFSMYQDKTAISDSNLRRSALRTDGLQVSSALVSAIATASGLDGIMFYEDLKQKSLLLDIWQHPPEPLLSGSILLSMGLRPGKHLGELIKASFELQLDGHLGNEDEAREWAYNAIKAQGLT